MEPAVWAIAVGVGSLIGFLSVIVYKKERRAAGDRSGALISPTSVVVGVSLGIFAAVIMFHNAGVTTLSSLLQLDYKSLYRYFPLLLEVAVILVKTDVFTLLLRVGGEEVEGETLEKTRLLHATFVDRLKHTLFVVNICLTAYIAGKAPEMMYVFYTAKV
tara:strand:+ start:372 stop:851 length:480 start_codon:yes stop_codon:yes gene_type:complete